jgi:uncharacterized protein with ParB-like and HNH nuclease domain
VTFRTAEPALKDVLDAIAKGEMQLPDFQRGWVWDDDHIRSLIASLSLSYPIGAVMFLRLAACHSNLGYLKVLVSSPPRRPRRWCSTVSNG